VPSCSERRRGDPGIGRGGSYTGYFERDMTLGSTNGASFCEEFQRGPGGRASLLGTPKDMLSKAQKWVSASIGTPLLRNLQGRFYLRAFLLRGIFMRFAGDMLSAL
jgi:hypothetical protein